MLWQPSNTARRLTPCREAAVELTGRLGAVSGRNNGRWESGRRRG
jgi:hypothetical protein